MTTVSLSDRTKVFSATTGTGTLTLGAATDNSYFTFAEAGITDGQTVRYEILDGLNVEIGTGVYTAAGTTLTRATVTLSKIGGVAGTSKITCSGNQTVSIVAVKEDIYYQGGTTVAITDGGTGQTTAGAAIGALISGSSEDTAPDATADYVGTYDASAATGKKVLIQNLAPYYFTNLAAPQAAANSSGVQQWFPSLGDITLNAATTYRFTGLLRIFRGVGTTSHTTSTLFGGTCTLESIRYISLTKTGDTVASAACNMAISDDATSDVVKAASTSSAEQIAIWIDGTCRVAAASSGTLIPEFQFSAAPGGVPTIMADSFFEIVAVGTDFVTSAGTWS